MNVRPHLTLPEYAIPATPGEPYHAYAHVYDRHGQSAWSECMVAFTLDLLSRYGATGRRVLDLACGTGAATLQFAAAGYAVTGVDNAPAMLAEARRKACGARDIQATEDVCFLLADLRTFTLPMPVNLVTCYYDSLNYLTAAADLARAFARVRAALVPGGLFVADMNTRAGLAADWNDQCRVRAIGETYFVEQTTWDDDTAIGTLTLTGFVPEGDGYQCFEETHRERGYTVVEITAALTTAALIPLDLFACDRHLGPTLNPPDSDTHRVILVARTAE